MTSGDWTRRDFLAAASAGSLAAVTSRTVPAYGNLTKKAGKLAILGGEPVRKNKSWPDWPYWDDKVVESVDKTTKSGIWCRIQSSTGTVATFEKEYAKLTGAKFCIGTGAGTQALHTCVEALGIGPGDEVITSPYTDPGTIASILSARALPVLADLDTASFQLDPDEVEKRITENTKAIMPVHMMGQPCDIDRIMAIAKKHNLKVIEDAAQAHLAEHRGRKLGTIGDVGCFSFQSSKIIACGEGGAIIGNDEALMDKCYTVHNHGTSRTGRTETIGPKYRMNEFEAAVLLGQLPGVLERHARRNENAAYLTVATEGHSLPRPPEAVRRHQRRLVLSLRDVLPQGASQRRRSRHVPQGPRRRRRQPQPVHRPGTAPRALDRERPEDEGLPEDVLPSSGCGQYREESACPKCDQVCQDMAMIWASGPLLGSKEDMAEIADAIEKVYENRDQLKSA